MRHSNKNNKILMNIGISEKDRAKIAKGLSILLANNYILYLQTHNFHWNVTGPMFNTLHLMFMEQYNELWLALDAIAERIRALGHIAPGNSTALATLSTLKDVDNVPDAMEMIEILMKGHEMVAATARKIFPVADAADDEATIDLLTQRLNIHEKTAWMLRSMLQ